MKRTICLISCLLCVLISYAQEDRLKGSWGPADKSLSSSVIEFRSDHTALLNVEGGTLLIDKYTVEKKGDLLVIKLKTNIDGYPASLYMLVEFQTGNTMKMEIFPPGSEKPAGFSKDAPDSQQILVKGN